MLYVSTRSTQDAFTAYRTMHQDRTPDGGFFVPMRMPTPEQLDLQSLGRRSFGQTVADILNLFFGTKLSAWDVEVAIGKRVVNIRSVGHRTLIGELWHNIDGSFDRVINSLACRIHPDGDCIGKPTDWLEIAIRIAVLFGIFGELQGSGELKPGKVLDVAVSSGSFASAMALWYGREMGLPVGQIICGCNENGAVWDLLHKGALDTDAIAVKTNTPEGDYAVPPDLERLICGTLGQGEALHYWWCCTEGSIYSPPELRMNELREGMFAAVVSRSRIETIIPSVYRTNAYILEPYSALAYGALSDYRSRTGSFNTALVLTEKSPLRSASEVSDYLRISTDELKRLMTAN